MTFILFTFTTTKLNKARMLLVNYVNKCCPQQS